MTEPQDERRPPSAGGAADWERRRRRNRRLQDAGLAVLALGVLVLVFLALTYRPG